VLLTRGPSSASPGSPAGGDTGFATVELFDAVAPRLSGFGEPSRFVF